MTKEESMEALLVNIRSVVQSKKGGIPVNSLQADYRNLIGERIPFGAYNFQSLHDFLLSIPQCVKLRKCNNQFYVEAVTNDSTSHLASLISKQKATKSKKVQPPPYSFRQTNLTKNSSGGSSSNVSTASQQFGDNIKKAQVSNNDCHQSNLTKNFSSGFSSNVSVASQEFEENLVIKNLMCELSNERKVNQNSSSEITHLKLELKNIKEALKSEQVDSRKLKESYEILKVSYERKKKEVERNNLLIKYHIQEIENLKVSLDKEKKVNEIFTSEIKSKNEELDKFQKQVNELQFSSKEKENYKKEIEDLKGKLEKEKRISRALSDRSEHLKIELENKQKSSDDKIKKLQNQISLQKEGKELLIQKEELSSWNTAVDLSETDLAKELKNTDSSPAFCNHSDLYAKLDEKIYNMKKEMQSQSQEIRRLMILQQQHYPKMDARIKKHCDSIGINTILQNLLVHPQFLKSLQSSLTLIAETGVPSASTHVESSADKTETGVPSASTHVESSADKSKDVEKFVHPGDVAMKEHLTKKERKRGLKKLKRLMQESMKAESSSKFLAVVPKIYNIPKI